MEALFNTGIKRRAMSEMFKLIDNELRCIDFANHGDDAIGYNEESNNLYMMLDVGVTMYINLDERDDIMYMWTNRNNGEEHHNTDLEVIIRIKGHFDECEFCGNKYCEYCNDEPEEYIVERKSNEMELQ
jgi:hypothetical protein